MLGFGEDDMVAQGDAEQLAGRGELLSEGDVFLAGRCLAGWMVVGDDDGGGSVGNGVGKNLARVGQYGVERADGYGALGDQPLPAVQAQDNKIFLLLGSQVVQPRQNILLRAQ